MILQAKEAELIQIDWNGESAQSEIQSGKVYCLWCSLLLGSLTGFYATYNKSCISVNYVKVLWLSYLTNYMYFAIGVLVPSCDFPIWRRQLNQIEFYAKASVGCLCLQVDSIWPCHPPTSITVCIRFESWLHNCIFGHIVILNFDLCIYGCLNFWNIDYSLNKRDFLNKTLCITYLGGVVDQRLNFSPF